MSLLYFKLYQRTNTEFPKTEHLRTGEYYILLISWSWIKLVLEALKVREILFF